MTEVRLRRVLFAALAALAFAAPAAAAPQDGSPLGVGYTIAFWALPFGHTHYDGKVSSDAYSAKMHFETCAIVIGLRCAMPFSMNSRWRLTISRPMLAMVACRWCRLLMRNFPARIFSRM